MKRSFTLKIVVVVFFCAVIRRKGMDARGEFALLWKREDIETEVRKQITKETQKKISYYEKSVRETWVIKIEETLHSPHCIFTRKLPLRRGRRIHI